MALTPASEEKSKDEALIAPGLLYATESTGLAVLYISCRWVVLAELYSERLYDASAIFR